MALSAREQFIYGAIGQELLQQYGMSSRGYWRIYGEDDLPVDMTVRHTDRDCVIFEGTLSEVIDRAVRFPEFCINKKSGGRIEKVAVEPAVTVQHKPHDDTSFYEILKTVDH